MDVLDRFCEIWSEIYLNADSYHFERMRRIFSNILFITTATRTGFSEEKAKLESFDSCKER